MATSALTSTAYVLWVVQLFSTFVFLLCDMHTNWGTCTWCLFLWNFVGATCQWLNTNQLMKPSILQYNMVCFQLKLSSFWSCQVGKNLQWWQRDSHLAVIITGLGKLLVCSQGPWFILEYSNRTQRQGNVWLVSCSGSDYRLQGQGESAADAHVLAAACSPSAPVLTPDFTPTCQTDRILLSPATWGLREVRALKRWFLFHFYVRSILDQ